MLLQRFRLVANWIYLFFLIILILNIQTLSYAEVYSNSNINSVFDDVNTCNDRKMCVRF